MRASRRAWNGNHGLPTVEQPRERDLRARGAVVTRDSSERRLSLQEIARDAHVVSDERAARPCTLERRPRHEGDGVTIAEVDDSIPSAIGEVVLVLHRSDSEELLR